MPKKEEVPKHIEKYHRLKKKLRRLLDTHRLEHSQAYVKAADELLKDEEGNIDYERLEDAKIQDRFVDKLVDHYLSKAKQAFKGIKPKDELEEDMFLRAYGTHTRGQLSQIIRKHGKEYTIQTHEEGRDELVKKLNQELGPTTVAHLKQEHIDDIIKYTKAGDIIAKEMLSPIEGSYLLDLYEEGRGAVTLETVKRHPGLGKKYVKEKKKAA